MTEPLIDRDALRDIVAAYGPVTQAVETTTTTLLVYLRSVLTPEALEPYNFRPSSTQGVYYGERSKGADLHRRIFGEED